MTETSEDFAALFEKSLEGGREIPMEGDVVRARVLNLTRDSVIVDFGHKCEGQIPLYEFLRPGGGVAVKVGESIDVYVESLETDNGLAALSKEKADALQIWDHLQEVADRDETIEGSVLSKVKGGLSVDIGVKAFLPASQVDLRPGNLDRLLGKKMRFKILKLNKRKGNIILSRRALLERDRDSARHDLLQGLKEGQLQKGTVKNITEYGAFIDLGGIDGLLHVTDMSWARSGHPSQVVSVGQEVTVKILRVDQETGKVSLGLKQLTQDPWSGVPEKYTVGLHVRGRVVNVTDFGAFVELEEGIEGLVHISEMTWSRKSKHPSKIVSAGDAVETVILAVDSVSRRISLGMKQVMPNPWEAAAEKYPVGTRLTGPVRNVTDFGIFVGLTDEVDGLAHISDLSWVRPARPLSEIYPKGSTVDVVVLHSDKENERFSLGVKQLSEDPWPKLLKEFGVGSHHAGRVLSITPRGVALELMPGVEGFVAAESLPEGFAQSPPLAEGEMVPVVVHSLEERERRIGLGLVVEGPEVQSSKRSRS